MIAHALVGLLAVGQVPFTVRGAVPFSHDQVQPLEPAVLARVQRATALVEIRGGSGTAFVIGTDGSQLLLVTNAHVLVPPRGMRPWGETVILDPGTASESKAIEARVLGRDEAVDLALLAIPAPPNPPEPLVLARTCEPIVGAPVFVAGFPFGTQLATGRGHPSVNLSAGQVAGRTGKAHLDLTVGVNPGNSGGPVITTGGHVVGVATAHLRGTEQSSAVSFEQIMRLLQRFAPTSKIWVADVKIVAPPATAPGPSDRRVGADGVPSAALDDRAALASRRIARITTSSGTGTGLLAARRGDELLFVTADAERLFRVRIGEGRLSVTLRGDARPRSGKVVRLEFPLAVVAVPRDGFSAEPFGFTGQPPGVTDVVAVLGFHPTSPESAFDVRLVNGNVSALRETEYQLDLGVNGGLMGGAVLDPATGDLLGALPRRAPGTNLSFAIPTAYLRELVSDLCGEAYQRALAREPVQPGPAATAAFERAVALRDRGSGPALGPAADAFDDACRAGHAVACTGLGIAYWDGRGVQPDRERSRRLFRRACKLGVRQACSDLWKRLGECPEG